MSGTRTKTKQAPQLVVYVSTTEVLVTTEDNEQAMLAEWFGLGKRTLLDYHRSDAHGTVASIASRVNFALG